MFRLFFLLFILFSFPVFACSTVCVSEVYFDGTDEWIELYSDEGFSGTITLSGLSQSSRSLSLTLTAGEVVVLGDQGGDFVGDTSYFLDNQGLQISDSSDISFTVTIGTSAIESYFISQTVVDSLNNTTTSIQIFEGDIFPSSISSGVVSGVIANPGLLYPEYYSSGLVLSGSGNSSGYNEFTGSVDSDGQSNNDEGTDYTYCSNCEGSNDSIVDILIPRIVFSEIYPFDSDNLSEYIELYFLDSYKGYLTIIGAGHGSAVKEIYVDQSSGSYLVITDDATGQVSLVKNIVLPTISLTNGGEELQLVGQSGQLIDTAVYNGGEDTYSLYSSGLFSGYSLFSKSATPSPGVSLEYINYLLHGENVSLDTCGVRIQNSNPFYHTNKVNFVGQLNGKDLSNASNYTCTWLGGFTGLNGCNPSFVSSPGSGIYEVSLEIYNLSNQLVCSSTLSVNIPEKVTVPSCRSDYYQGLYLKWKDRFGNLKKQISSEGFTVSASGDIISKSDTQYSVGESVVYQSGYRLIRSLLPNPLGKDVGNEGIILDNISSLAGITSGLYLYNGRSYYTIDSFLFEPGESRELYGNFGLTNSQKCIQLTDKQVVYDVICYSQPKEGEWIVGNHPQVGSNGITHIADMSFEEKDDILCINYENTETICQDMNGFLYSKRKQKEIDKLQKELDKSLSWKEKYTKQVELKNKQKEAYSSQLEVARGKSDTYNYFQRLYASYIRLVDEYLYEQRQPVYYDQSLYDIRGLLSKLKNEGSQNGILYSSLYPYDIASQRKIKQNIIPLEYVDIEELYTYISFYWGPVVDSLL